MSPVRASCLENHFRASKAPRVLPTQLTREGVSSQEAKNKKKKSSHSVQFAGLSRTWTQSRTCRPGDRGDYGSISYPALRPERGERPRASGQS